MKWLYITSIKDVHVACDYYKNSEVLGLDLETGNVETGEGVFEPYSGDISLMQISDGSKTVLIDVFALYEEAKIPKIKINGVTMFDYTKGYHLFDKIREILENPSIKIVIHNAKFEHKWLLAKCNIYCNAVFDTFLAAQLIDYNSDNDPKRRHNLAAVGRRWIGVDLDKTEQSSDWGVRPLSENQKEYAAYDVIYSSELRKALLESLISKKLLRVAKIEFDAVGVVAKIELRGLKVNRTKYLEEIATLEKLRAKAEKALQAKVKQDGGMIQSSLFGLPEKDSGEVMLTSSSQMKEALNRLEIPVFSKKEIEQFEAFLLEERFINSLGINDKLKIMKERFPKFDFDLYKNYKSAKKEGKKIIQGTGAKAMLALDKTDYEVLGNLKEFRGTDKMTSSFGANFLEHLRWCEENHERVYANFKQIGAPTGRFACFNPNLQQIPAGELVIDGEKHVVKFRECFDFPVGYKGVNADYSQIELRIAAELSGDQNMIDTFESGRDLHADTASKVFGVPYELCAQDGHEYYKTYRKYSKSINFGIVYGMGADALSVQINVTKEEAQAMIDKYSEAYPDLWQYLQNQKSKAKRTLQARTASGRLQEFTAPSDDLDEDSRRIQLSAIGRNGMNMPIQGTSADILKRALKLLDEALAPYNAYIVNIVHDEIMVEALDDENLETVRKLVEDCMIAAAKEYVKKVPIKVDAKIVDNWSDK
jgi:DNA polymerase I-like protein with 3'-5' exonuclease and polymerase domains